jgi:4,5-DOPA dioxygenase extradiol
LHGHESIGILPPRFLEEQRLMIDRMPTLFVSHGAPSLLVDQDPTFDFFKRLGGILPRPKAVLCVSAHWERHRLAVSGSPRPGTIHDFYGFAEELYDMRYPCPGDPALAESVQKLMTAAACACDIDDTRGLDHGAWVPLTLMYPDADIPVVQLTLQKGAGTEQHLQIGRALAPLRAEGVLIMGSGSATHNLREFGSYPLDARPQAYAVEFEAWLFEAIRTAQEDDVINYRSRAPHAVRNHPTEDHIWPLFVPLGAAGEGATGGRLYEGYTYGILSMAAYAWGL